MEQYTWEELLKLDITKSQIATKIGITGSYDTALPQTWLDNFILLSGLDYNEVLYSTFMVYGEHQPFDMTVSGLDKVNKWL